MPILKMIMSYECHKKAIYSFVSSGQECINAMVVFWLTLWETVEAPVFFDENWETTKADGHRSSCPLASMSSSGAIKEIIRIHGVINQ